MLHFLPEGDDNLFLLQILNVPPNSVAVYAVLSFGPG